MKFTAAYLRCLSYSSTAALVLASCRLSPAADATFDWAIPLPGNIDYSPPVAVDAGSNILVGSSSQGITKMDQNGTVLWTVALEAPVFALTTDAAGACYAVARADTNMTSLGGETPIGTGSAVLSKISAGGELEWIRRDGRSNRVWPYHLKVGPEGSFYVGGQCDGEAEFQGTPLPKVEGTAGYVAKYTGQGGLVWAKGLTGTPVLEVDQTGSVLVGLGPDLTKLSSNGDELWSRTVTDAGGMQALAVDPAGNVFLSTRFFDGFIQTQRLAKWSASGEQLWEHIYEFTGSSRIDFRSLASNAKGECLVAVQNGQPEVEIGPLRLTTLGVVSVAVLKFSAAGELRWGISSVGVDPISSNVRRSDARNPTLTLGPSDQCHLAGCFYGTVRFGPVELVGRNYGNPFQPFVARVFDPATAVPAIALGISRNADSLVLTWPVSASGFVVQTAASLGPSQNWRPVNGQVKVNSDVNSIRLNLPSRDEFYRLATP